MHTEILETIENYSFVDGWCEDIGFNLNNSERLEKIRDWVFDGEIEKVKDSLYQIKVKAKVFYIYYYKAGTFVVFYKNKIMGFYEDFGAMLNFIEHISSFKELYKEFYEII